MSRRSGCCCIASSIDQPLCPGNRISSRTRSTGLVLRRGRPSSALLASSTSWPRAWRFTASSRRIFSSSSTVKIVAIVTLVSRWRALASGLTRATACRSQRLVKLPVAYRLCQLLRQPVALDHPHDQRDQRKRCEYIKAERGSATHGGVEQAQSKRCEQHRNS